MSERALIRQYILQNMLFTDDESELIDRDSLLDAGIVDSTGMLEVILFVEESFGIKVQDDEMIPENLDSVDNLVSFIERKRSLGARSSSDA